MLSHDYISNTEICKWKGLQDVRQFTQHILGDGSPALAYADTSVCMTCSTVFWARSYKDTTTLQVRGKGQSYSTSDEKGHITSG